VGAARGQRPADDAGFGLGYFPAGGLFAAVVAPAFGAQVALIGEPLGVRHGVIAVAVHGLGVAAGGVAGGAAGADDVPELAAGGVAALGMPVVTGTAGDGLESDVQGAEQVAEPCGLGGVRARRCCPRWCGWRDAAATRSRVSSGSSRPQAPAWAGASDQPRRVPTGTVKRSSYAWLADRSCLCAHS